MFVGVTDAVGVVVLVGVTVGVTVLVGVFVGVGVGVAPNIHCKQFSQGPETIVADCAKLVTTPVLTV